MSKCQVSFLLVQICFEHTETSIRAKLFGRTQSNEKVCLEDERVYDYVLVDCRSNTKEALDKVLVALKEQEYKFEFFDAQIHDNSSEFLKIFTPSLKKTEHLVETLLKKHDFDCYEHDLPFLRKYLLEKNICFGEIYLATYTSSSLKELVDVSGKLLSLENIPKKSISIHENVLFFDIETFDDGKGIDYEKNPILAISLVTKEKSYNLVSRKYPTALSNVELFDNELDLLQRFVEIIKLEKPDVLSGYNSKGFDIPYIIHRCSKFKVDLSIGADGSSIIPLKTKAGFFIHGILLLDIFVLLRHIFRFAVTNGSLSLDNVSKELLHKEKDVVDFRKVSSLFSKKDFTDDDISLIDSYITYCEKDTILTSELYDYFFTDIKEFQHMLNIDIEEISLFSFSQIVEGFLIHNARSCNQVIPNKPSEEDVRLRQYKRIKGAFVFDPKPGFYKNISVYDFTSLYPTVIAAHNITKGTISQKEGVGYKPVPEQDFFIRTEPQAFIPTIIQDIVSRRIRIKAVLKSAKESDVPALSSRLQTLKIIANSLYGYLAFYMARWYSFEAAESVTAFARYHIKDVIRIFSEKGFSVIYSDTDSVFVLENKTIKESTDAVVEVINSTLPGLMSLEKEDTFIKGMFVGQRGSEKGAKKKYALLDKNGKYKIAGMAMVRGDFSVLAKRMQEEVIHILLETENVSKAISYVKNQLSTLETLSLSEFVITTKLKKPVSEYASKGPHVIVAERMLASKKHVRVGQNISYVICKSADSKATIGERARLESEISSVSDVDFEYYKKNQIYPVLESLFDVFDVDIVSECEKKEKGLSDFF